MLGNICSILGRGVEVAGYHTAEVKDAGHGAARKAYGVGESSGQALESTSLSLVQRVVLCDITCLMNHKSAIQLSAPCRYQS